MQCSTASENKNTNGKKSIAYFLEKKTFSLQKKINNLKAVP